MFESQFRQGKADYCSILSVENRAGALSHHRPPSRILSSRIFSSRIFSSRYDCAVEKIGFILIIAATLPRKSMLEAQDHSGAKRRQTDSSSARDGATGVAYAARIIGAL